MYDDYPLSMHDFSLHDPFMLADRRTGLYYLTTPTISNTVPPNTVSANPWCCIPARI